MKDLTTPGRIGEARPDPSTCIITVEGDADLDLAPELGTLLKGAVADGVDLIVVDLTSATLLDSMALGVLVRVAKRVRSLGTQLRLVVPQPQLRRIFEITLLERVLPLHATIAEALEAAAEQQLPRPKAVDRAGVRRVLGS